jgi:ribosomal protein S18 acetylase RimI-like enzyme
MIIRPAIKDDIIYIRMILERDFDEIMSKYHSKEILDKFKAHNSYDNLVSQLSWKRIYVAEKNGQIIATGSFANFGTSDSPKHSVSNLYVLPEFQNMGIGKLLVTKLIEDAIEENALEIHVPSSRNAVGFYKKMGFESDKEQPDLLDEITWMTMQIDKSSFAS